MNYRYFLEHSPDTNHPLREMDLKVRLRMAREAQPNIPTGREAHQGPVAHHA